MKVLKKGRDGKIFELSRHRVMKQYRFNKNAQSILREYNLHSKAAQHGLAPRLYGMRPDEEGRVCVVMERLDHTLMDEIRKDNELTVEWQREMIRILSSLDQLGIFHGDVSPLNFMVKNGKLFVIDFGMSREIDLRCNKDFGQHPNLSVGLTTFVVKLREFVPNFSPRLFQKYLAFKE